MTSLTELNLRRNRIQYVQGLEKLPALQRVFLSHNSIQSLKDVWCLFEVQYLIELSLDGNPVAEIDPSKYREHVIKSIPTLKHLDLKRITEDDRNSILGQPDTPIKQTSESTKGADSTKGTEVTKDNEQDANNEQSKKLGFLSSLIDQQLPYNGSNIDLKSPKAAANAERLERKEEHVQSKLNTYLI